MCCKQDHSSLDYFSNEHYSYVILQNKAYIQLREIVRIPM